MSISQKISITVTGIGVLCLIIVVGFSYNLQKSVLNERKNTNKHVVETAWSILDHYGTLEQQGVLGRDEAMNRAIEEIKSLRYKNDDYFWINDMQPRMIMHPFKPQLDGKEIGEVKDPEGTYLFREMVAVCSSEGQGYVEYMWPKPGKDRPEQKISFVKLYKPWGWIVGSGMYLDDIHAELSAVRNTSIGILVVLAAGLIVLFLWITRSISGPVRSTSAGLLEIGTQLENAAAQVSSSSQMLAQASSEQAASLEETSSSLIEMSSKTNLNADNAVQADNLMNEAQDVISRANASMSKLTGSMDDISRSSSEISKIISTIDEIAFQTNLLALNAAVEAARAGEAGKGFAVVAEEVRNLAGRSAEAAKNTAALIESTVGKITEGTNIVQHTSGDFSAVLEKTGQAAALVSEIAASSQEQARGIEQVKIVVNDMDKVTQQNAASAEQSSSAAQELNSLAAQMRRFMDDLCSLVGGKDRGSAASPAVVSGGSAGSGSDAD